MASRLRRLWELKVISPLRLPVPNECISLLSRIGFTLLSTFLPWRGAEASPEARGEIIYPASAAAIEAAAESTSGGEREYPYWRILMVGGILSGGAALFVYQFIRRGRMSLPRRSRESGLQLCETRMLGSKQFLVVVEYGGQRMLLGVGPGFP